MINNFFFYPIRRSGSNRHRKNRTVCFQINLPIPMRVRGDILIHTVLTG